jgi:hypothetical protein
MAAQRRRADDVEDCEYDADDVGEREREKKSLHCTTAKSIAHRSPHRAEDDEGVW